MAKEQKPTEQLDGIAEQAMEQARHAADIYFDYVKQAISATPSGGNEFAENLKECAEKNITATQEFLKQLSQARNFQDVVRVQSDYMKFLMNAFGEQSLAEAYTKTAADAVKKSLTYVLIGRRSSFSGLSRGLRDKKRRNDIVRRHFLDGYLFKRIQSWWCNSGKPRCGGCPHPHETLISPERLTYCCI